MDNQSKTPVIKQLCSDIKQYMKLVFANYKNLLISLAFPIIGILILLFIAGDNVFVTYEATRTSNLILVCVALWGGMFNTMQTIVSDKRNLHRTITTTDFTIGSYILSRVCVQLILCAIQSAICTASYPLVCLKFDVSMQEHGIIFDNILAEYFVSLFIITVASDMMGLLISSLVKKPETASILAPYILIAQLIFSGILFKMENLADILSRFVLSRWGMEALGSTSNLNEMQLAIQQKIPQYVHEAEDIYEATAKHMWNTWIILGCFIIVLVVGASIVLKRSITHMKRS